MHYLITFVIVLVSCAYISVEKIHRAYLNVELTYKITDLTTKIKKNRAILQNLKSERAKLMIPTHLEDFAGRGGYLIPRSEQIIVLDQDQ